LGYRRRKWKSARVNYRIVGKTGLFLSGTDGLEACKHIIAEKGKKHCTESLHKGRFGSKTRGAGDFSTSGRKKSRTCPSVGRKKNGKGGKFRKGRLL